MRNVVIIVASLFLITSIAHAAHTQAWKFDPAYLGNVTYLYDQSEVIATESFKKASDSDRQKMLIEEFQSRKDSQYTQLLTSYWGATIPIGLFAFYKLFSSRRDAPAQEAQAVVPAHLAFAGGAGVGLIMATLVQPSIYLFMNPLTNEIEKVWTTLLRFSSSKWKKATAVFASAATESFDDDELGKLEKEYILRKREIAPSLWGPTESVIAKARIAQSSINGPVGKPIDSVAFIKRVLALPNNVKPLKFDSKQIEKEFAGYDLDSKDALLEVSLRFIMASRKDSPVSKIALYFYGPAGVGKTEAARRLAKVMDVAIGEVSLEKVTHINDLIGWPKDHANAGPGLIAEAMIRANKDGKGSKNMKLLFDEADRMLNQVKHGSSNELVTSLLKILESKTRSYYNPYFEADISVDQVDFNFIGNSALKDRALRNRFQSVEFKGFVPGYKLQIIADEYIPQLLEQDFAADPVLGLNERISEQDWLLISDMVKRDKDPGFRTIHLNVRRFLEHKVLEKQFGGSVRPFTPVEFDAQERFVQ